MGQLMTSTVKTIYNTLYSCKESLPKSVMFSKMSENAMTPTRGSCGAAGYDLYAAYDAQIPAQGKALVKTDIAVALPEGWYGRVAPRFVFKFHDFNIRCHYKRTLGRIIMSFTR